MRLAVLRERIDIDVIAGRCGRVIRCDVRDYGIAQATGRGWKQDRAHKVGYFDVGKVGVFVQRNSLPEVVMQIDHRDYG